MLFLIGSFEVASVNVKVEFLHKKNKGSTTVLVCFLYLKF